MALAERVTDSRAFTIKLPTVPPPPPPPPPPEKFPWVLPASLIIGLFLFLIGSKNWS